MELTNKQVELAVQAFVAEFGTADSLEGIAEQQKIAMRAAAPFLQLPWDEPTEQECEQFYRLDRQARPSPRSALEDFVRRRNAALTPNPVDPRHQRVAEVLKQYLELPKDRAGWSAPLVGHILAALDGKQEPEFKFGFTGFNPLESAANDHMYQTVVLDRPAPPREGFKKNPADMPKVVDSRKEKIVSGIERYGYIGDKYALADMILAAIDEVK